MDSLYKYKNPHLEIHVTLVLNNSLLKDLNKQIYFFFIVNKIRDDSDIKDLERVAGEKGEVYTIYNDINCLSLGWNKGIEMALQDGCDYVFVPNLDLYFNSNCLDNLVEGASKSPDCIFWCATGVEIEKINSCPTSNIVSEDLDGSSFSYFLIDKKLIEQVGYFDTKFAPAYFEDNDMYYRITLVGGKFGRVHDAIVYHHGSGTLKCDAELQNNNHITFVKNREYYISKWGGMPHQEAYGSPFNGQL
jgi:GT2 family glycosyltransferase